MFLLRSLWHHQSDFTLSIKNLTWQKVKLNLNLMPVGDNGRFCDCLLMTAGLKAAKICGGTKIMCSAVGSDTLEI